MKKDRPLLPALAGHVHFPNPAEANEASTLCVPYIKDHFHLGKAWHTFHYIFLKHVLYLSLVLAWQMLLHMRCASWLCLLQCLAVR